ncbi:MAG: cytochrome c-type biogenesis protein [Cocleimonas sp.]
MMAWLKHPLLFVLLLSLMPVTYAVKIEFHSFENKQQEKLYLQLIAELRCVKCQNQNLAESNAELASDMREKTYDMVVKGGSRDDVVKYMTARYGDFVLYKPPFKAETLLLWIGPPVFLFLSLYMLFKLIRKQKTQTTETLSKADREKVRELLSTNTKK